MVRSIKPRKQPKRRRRKAHPPLPPIQDVITGIECADGIVTTNGKAEVNTHHVLYDRRLLKYTYLESQETSIISDVPKSNHCFKTANKLLNNSKFYST